LSYFNQVLLKDFTPLSGPLVLNKILIVYEEEVTPKAKTEDGDSEEEEATVDFDYGKMTEGLFFRVFQCQMEEEVLLFD